MNGDRYLPSSQGEMDANSPDYWRNRSDGRAPVPTVTASTSDRDPALPDERESLVNEAMNLYYNRDAAGLKAFLRKVLR